MDRSAQHDDGVGVEGGRGLLVDDIVLRREDRRRVGAGEHEHHREGDRQHRCQQPAHHLKHVVRLASSYVSMITKPLRGSPPFNDPAPKMKRTSISPGRKRIALRLTHRAPSYGHDASHPGSRIASRLAGATHRLTHIAPCFADAMHRLTRIAPRGSSTSPLFPFCWKNLR